METSNTSVSHILFLMDQAFYKSRWHSVLGNLKAVTPEDWLWVPPDGVRSIRDIVAHIGACKFMYENHAFGDATFTWNDPLVQGGDRLSTIPSAIEWLEEGQARLRESVTSLDDAQLLQPTKANWGESVETRWIISVMLEHDLYHAGEINHIRCLHQKNDG